MITKELSCNSFCCINLLDDAFLIIKKILFKSKFFYEKLITFMLDLDLHNQYFDIDKMIPDNPNIPKKQYQLSKFFNCSYLISKKIKNYGFFIEDEKEQKKLEALIKKLPIYKYTFFKILNCFLYDPEMQKYDNYHTMHKLFIKLIKKYHEENMDLLKNAIEHVDKFIWKHYGNRQNVEDLISAGREGIIEGFYRYDGEKYMNKFNTYIFWWVKNKIFNEMENCLPVKYDYKILKSYIKNDDKLFELDNYDKLCLENINNHMNYNTLASNIYDDSDEFVIEQNMILESKEQNMESNPENILIKKEHHTLLYNAMNILTEFEKDILSKKFGLNGNKPENDKKICFAYNIKKKELNKYLEVIYKKLRQNIKLEAKNV